MSEETRWVTYEELATALGIAPDSARRLVNRRRWPRMTGNDGKARIQVPVERLSPDKSGDVTPDSPPDTEADVSPDVPPVIQILARQLERIEKDLDEARAERDREHSRAAELGQRLAEVEAARSALEGQATAMREMLAGRDLEMVRERDRVTHLSAQLVQATARATEAAGAETELRSRLEAMATELRALQARPWWRRLLAG